MSTLTRNSFGKSGEDKAVAEEVPRPLFNGDFGPNTPSIYARRAPERATSSRATPEHLDPLEREVQAGGKSPTASLYFQKLLKSIDKKVQECEEPWHQLLPNHLWVSELHQLKALLQSFSDASLVEKQQYRKHCCLASLDDCLGSYRDVDLHYRAALPQMFPRQVDSSHSDFKVQDLHPPDYWLRTDSSNNLVEILPRYLSFLIGTKSKLGMVEEILDILPWLSSAGENAAMADLGRPKFLFLKIRLLNAQSNHRRAPRLGPWRLAPSNA